ncbi:Der GTPase-activating protein YihI [Colwellia sp. E2M01]|uniref:Der GTPase-activating protein YihI n=1 Tax=Colwellia sp. E2M01 TaxID=2841561 RepID=UPI001C091CBD|nr:Der GTPase-activating protein YihI [Colwellia sp. E2M01]MBU2871165.1 GTPase-activating protein [Colwellia sp. E2M01]
MSRSKKSRKPGGAPTAKPKLSKQELANVEKRIRKTTGKVAGNRQKEATQKQNDANQKGVKKDPRLGNKTPIVLVAKDKSKEAKVKPNDDKLAPMARVRFVENEDAELVQQAARLSPEDELNAIEDDAQLQAILAKQEDDIALTEEEVNYYNDMMDRHQALSAELGLDEYDDSEESDDEAVDNDSEDELWDKLDRPNFSDFDDSSK